MFWSHVSSWSLWNFLRLFSIDVLIWFFNHISCVTDDLKFVVYYGYCE